MMGSMKTMMIDFIKSLRMPKIPGDTGEPAGAIGSMAGLKMKARTKKIVKRRKVYKSQEKICYRVRC